MKHRYTTHIVLTSSVSRASGRDWRLIGVKTLHTAVWAIMAGCVLVLPVLAFMREFRWVIIVTVIMIGECAVLAVNGGRCPLTDWAARYTDHRAENFDIYLPNWLAKHNKAIFGTLFVVNEIVVLWRWLGLR